MKLYLLLIIASLAIAQNIDYSSGSQYSGVTACYTANPWTGLGDFYNFQSPIAIQNTQCLPYGSFSFTATNPGSQQYALDDGAVTSTGAFLYSSYDGTGTGSASLKVDNREWTSDAILVRRGSEHRIYLGDNADPSSDAAMADFEVQVRFADTTGKLAFFSFLIKSYDDTNVDSTGKPTDGAEFAKYQSAQNLNPFISFDTTTPLTIDIDLAGIASLIQSKQSQDYFINVFTYNGTTTYNPCDDATWFIYGSFLYTKKSYVTATNTAITGSSLYGSSLTPYETYYNVRTPGSQANGGSGSGKQNAARLCFTGYYDVYLNWNYGLWFGVVIIVFFFIITLSTGESPITDPDYKEEVKTIHPWASLWIVSNELHTRKTRASIILAILTIHALFDSVFYRTSKNPEQKANIVVYAAYSMVISQFLMFFYGMILRHYYVCKREFLKTKDEKHNQSAQNSLFLFYSTLFALIAICWPFCVWNMNELNPHLSQTSSNYWVASFFVGLGFEWLVIDFVWMALAKKVNFVRDLARKKGFFYDDLCHATYMDYLKMD